MKCSQVTRQVFCRFYFQNTADEDYYILRPTSPLEGLRYPYLTISQGDKVIEYRGIHVSRMAPTKDSYVLIEAGKTITSPVVDLTSSYKFDSDGTYTIEYTKPFVYISVAEMSMIDDDKNLPQATGYDDLVASTKIELRDAYYLKPTDYEVEMANWEFKRKTSLDNDQTVYISVSCMPINFVNPTVLGNNAEQMKSDIRELHKKLCETAYPNAITDATSNSKKAPYTSFFGSNANKEKVINVLTEVKDGLQNNKIIMYYSFRGPKCESEEDIAYSYYAKIPVGTQHVIYFCLKFETLSKYMIHGQYLYNTYSSKFKTMAHEYTHVFANTEDFLYGYHSCKYWINAQDAVNNADSYAYYVQDVDEARAGTGK